jgi:hypothetical protein
MRGGGRRAQTQGEINQSQAVQVVRERGCRKGKGVLLERMPVGENSRWHEKPAGSTAKE